jgi:hypothetical protein
LLCARFAYFGPEVSKLIEQTLYRSCGFIWIEPAVTIGIILMFVNRAAAMAGALRARSPSAASRHPRTRAASLPARFELFWRVFNMQSH